MCGWNGSILGYVTMDISYRKKKKKLMYHSRMSMECRAKEKGQRAHFGTPGVDYTHGVDPLLKARKLW